MRVILFFIIYLSILSSNYGQTLRLNKNDVQEVLTIIFTGQSNAANGDPNMTVSSLDRSNDERVKIWNDITGKWQIADLTKHPWDNKNNHNLHNNRLAFHLAKRIAEKENKEVRLIFEAHGGKSIIEWMSRGYESPYLRNIVNQINNSRTDKVDGIFWVQGESDASDLNYHKKLQELIKLFRQLPQVSISTPFIAAELAQGLNANGVRILDDLSPGEVLNRRFYRPFVNFIKDPYFNVAQGSHLPTIEIGKARGIHFDGQAIVDYSYIIEAAYYNTPRQEINLDNIVSNIPKVYTDNGPLNSSNSKFFLLSASTDNRTFQLPYATLGKELWLKRIDTSMNTLQVKTITGESIDNEVNRVLKIKNGETLILKASNSQNYDIIGRLKSNFDSNTLSGLKAYQFMRVDEFDAKTKGNLRFNDKITLSFGNDDDYKFYHDGKNNVLGLKNGDFKIRNLKTATNLYSFDKDIGRFGLDVLKFNSIFKASTLPPGFIGDLSIINDAKTFFFGQKVRGGGDKIALVMYDGTNWVHVSNSRDISRTKEEIEYSNDNKTSTKNYVDIPIPDTGSVNWNGEESSLYFVKLNKDAKLENPINPIKGECYQFIVKQDFSGNRKLTYGSKFKFSNMKITKIAMNPSSKSVIKVLYDGEDLLVLSIISYL